MQVDFANEDGVRRLESAIAFANPIKDVDTVGIEPMYSVLDGETLRYFSLRVLMSIRSHFKVSQPYFEVPEFAAPVSFLAYCSFRFLI